MPAPKPKILCIAGSLRKDSVNKKLVCAAMQYAIAVGARVTFADLKDYAMPVYDGDIETEQGIPQPVARFQRLLKAHQGLLISSPSYLGTLPGALKNAFDWASRIAPGVASNECFDGKVAGMLSASPGAFGGLNVLTPLRGLLSNVKMFVIPEQFALPLAYTAFNDDGSLKDPKQAAAVKVVVEHLIDATQRMHARSRKRTSATA